MMPEAQPDPANLNDMYMEGQRWNRVVTEVSHDTYKVEGNISAVGEHILMPLQLIQVFLN